ncbi:MAG: DUF1330 domain-containing protein [Alphaproteobacteria bacterium]|jgi:uncharacterized protein (DUF1330 family)|nr:DUF1330 domain-containing protein [Alphaproteobacteria bacterium]
MAAYFIAHRKDISDSEKLRAYARTVDETIERFGGEVLARCDGFEVLEGDWESGANRDDDAPERVTIIRFPDMGSLRSWYGSQEYRELKAIRQESSVSDVVAIEGKA